MKDEATALLGGPRIDGRTARGQRTRARLISTVLDLVAKGELRLTAPTIASSAGVSIRSLFQHFPDLESLWIAAADRALELTLPLLKPVASEGPLEPRLQSFLEQRARVLEATTPMRQAALVLAPTSQEMQQRFATARRVGLDEIERAFGAELSTYAGAERDRLVHALEIATNWASWNSLRGPIGLSPDAAREVMAHTVRALLTSRSAG